MYCYVVNSVRGRKIALAVDRAPPEGGDG